MRLFTLLLASTLCTCSLAARADVTGTSVTGGLFFSSNNGVSYGTTNYFSPANGFVPAGYGNTASNTVTIGSPLVEFGFNDGANLITANFTGTSLSVSEVDTYGSLPFEMTFTDAAFTGISQLTPTPGFSYTFSGHTLDVFFVGTTTPGTYTDSPISTSPAVTPEPSSLLLLGTGALGAFGMVRRRFSRTA